MRSHGYGSRICLDHRSAHSSSDEFYNGIRRDQRSNITLLRRILWDPAVGSLSMSGLTAAVTSRTEHRAGLRRLADEGPFLRTVLRRPPVIVAGVQIPPGRHLRAGDGRPGKASASQTVSRQYKLSVWLGYRGFFTDFSQCGKWMRDVILDAGTYSNTW